MSGLSIDKCIELGGGEGWRREFRSKEHLEIFKPWESGASQITEES